MMNGYGRYYVTERLNNRMFPRVIGIGTAGKLQSILATHLFSQHAKLNMAGFVLYLLDDFALRCTMVGFHPKTRIEFPCGENER
jgi:uncharacterized membrane protein YjjP (DUF1212 family)